MSEYAIQKIKFNKTISITKIKKLCKSLGLKSITIKNLKTTNDVQNLSTKFFVAKSYKKEKHPEFVIIIGRLKPSHVSMHGAGIGDIFNKIKSGVSNFFSVRKGFNNKAQAMIQKYGDMTITNLKVFRAPINNSSIFVKVINGLSTKNIPYETLFHLGLIINDKIRIEKNEIIEFDDNFTQKSETEMSIPLKKSISINDLINNLLAKVNHDQIFTYSSFEKNCQKFVQDILKSNDLYTNDIDKFVYQPMDQLVKNVSPVVPKIANAVTNTLGWINKMRGGGKLLPNEIKLLKQIVKMLNN